MTVELHDIPLVYGVHYLYFLFYQGQAIEVVLLDFLECVDFAGFLVFDFVDVSEGTLAEEGDDLEVGKAVLLLAKARKLILDPKSARRGLPLPVEKRLLRLRLKLEVWKGFLHVITHEGPLISKHFLTIYFAELLKS